MAAVSGLLFVSAAAPSVRAEELQVVDWNGTRITMHYRADESVAALKSALQATRGIPPAQQRILMDGRPLADSTTLAEAGVAPGNTLSLEIPPTRWTRAEAFTSEGNAPRFLLHAENLVGGLPYRLEASDTLGPDADWKTLRSWTSEWGSVEFTFSRYDHPTRFFRLAAPETPGTWLARSHTVTPTYPDAPPDFRQLSVVESSDGAYWAAMAEYPSDNLYLMKCDALGRTLVPPCKVGTLRGSTGDSDLDYPFGLVATEDGGVQILASEKDPDVATYSGCNGLKLYQFSADGLCVQQHFLFHFADHDDYYRDIQCFRTGDGRTVFTANFLHNDTLVCGVIDATGHLFTFPIREDIELDYDSYFETCFLPGENRLVLFIFAGEFNGNYNVSTLERWTLDGQLEARTDISSLFSYDPVGAGNHPRLLETSGGILLVEPIGTKETNPPPRLLIFDPESLTLTGNHLVEGLCMHLSSADCRYALAETAPGEILMAWKYGDYFNGHHLTMISAKFRLDGTLLWGPWEIPTDVSRKDPRNARLFIHDGSATTFYGYIPAGESSRWDLAVNHIGEDYQAGLPDLVVSMDMVGQSPFYALLNSEVAIRGHVSNQGEAASASATLRLTHSGQQQNLAVPALEPGEAFDFQFEIPTPVFLTSLPEYQLEILGDAGWECNNSLSRQIRFPDSTPIYPENSASYTWTVRDKATHDPISRAYFHLTLTGVKTVSGTSRDVTLTGTTDEEGRFTTILPPGAYTIRLSKPGYPTTEYPVNVPNPATTTLELEPPGTLACTFSDSASGDPLNPAPGTVTIDLDDHPQGFTAFGRGDASGLELADVMPGTYTAHISAIGYQPATASVTIVGGRTNNYSFALDPLPRATVSGTVVKDGDGSPVAHATVRIAEIFSRQTTTGSDGAFEIENVPYGDFTLVVEEDGYRTHTAHLHIDDDPFSAGEIRLVPIVSKEMELASWKTIAYTKIAEFPDSFFSPGYKVETSFGAFKTDARLDLEQTGDAADLDKITLDIEGLAWCSYSVSTPFSITDLLLLPLDGTAEATGELCATLAELADGSGVLDSLTLDVGAGGNIGQTVVRVDRTVIRQGETVVWDTGFHPRYSTESPLSWSIGGAHLDTLAGATISVYVHVSDENYNIGPLYLSDNLRFDWKWDGGKFRFQPPVTNPSDYPHPGEN